MPVYNRMPKSLKLYKWEKRASFYTQSYYINKYTNKLSDGGIFKETIIGSEIQNGEFDTNYGIYYIDEDESYCYYANMIKEDSEVKEKGPKESVQGYVYSTNPLAYPPDGEGKDGWWYTILPESIDNGYSFYSVHDYLSYSYLQAHFLNKSAPLTQHFIDYNIDDAPTHYETAWGYFDPSDIHHATGTESYNLITFYNSNNLIYDENGNDFNLDGGQDSLLSGNNIIAFDSIPLYFSTREEGKINEYNQIFINNSEKFIASSDSSEKILGSLNLNYSFIQYSPLPFHVSIKNPEESEYRIQIKDSDDIRYWTLDPGEEFECYDLYYTISIVGLTSGKEYILPLIKVKFVNDNNELDENDLRNSEYQYYKIITAKDGTFNIPAEIITAYVNYNGEVLNDEYSYCYNSYIPNSFIYVKNIPADWTKKYIKII